MDIYVVHYMTVFAGMMQTVKIELDVMLTHQIKLFI